MEQVKRCVDSGAEIVRITVQGRKEAAACGDIRNALFRDGYDVPLVADIHFQPQVALMVADAFEKIRINPGNFADGRKTFEEINYDDPAQFRAEQEQIREVRQGWGCGGGGGGGGGPWGGARGGARGRHRRRAPACPGTRSPFPTLHPPPSLPSLSSCSRLWWKSARP